MYHVTCNKKPKHLIHDSCSIIHDKRGFTLIEAVVATAVFAFVVSSIIAVYLSTFRIDRKTRAQRAVTQNARFITEFLAKEVQNGMINYASYPGGIVPANPSLYVQNQANELEQFYLNETNIVLSKGGSSTNLNSAGVKVTRLNFLIAPTRDPYTPAKAANQQPHVTVILQLTSNYGNNAAETAKLDLQNTYSTRSYPSRQ